MRRRIEALHATPCALGVLFPRSLVPTVRHFSRPRLARRITALSTRRQWRLPRKRLRKRSAESWLRNGNGHCRKTYTTVNQIYRLMKSGVAKRVLFLVDRRALAAQAVRAFSSFEAEPGLKFHQIYETFYSQKFPDGRLRDENEPFDSTSPAGGLPEKPPARSCVRLCLHNSAHGD